MTKKELKALCRMASIVKAKADSPCSFNGKTAVIQGSVFASLELAEMMPHISTSIRALRCMAAMDEDLKITADGGMLKVEGSRSSGAFVGIEAMDHVIPEPPVTLSEGYSDAVFNSIAKVVYATTSGSYYPVLAHVNFTEGKLVATDTHRMAVVDVPGTGFTGLIHGDVCRLILGTRGPIGIGQYCLKSGGITAWSDPCESAYPDWGRVIPKEHTREFAFDTAQLMGALKKLLPVARENFNRVFFEFADGVCTLNTRSSLVGSLSVIVDAPGTMPAPFSIAFNAYFILDHLKRAGATTVFRCTEIAQPGTWHSDGFMTMIMPMILSFWSTI